MEKFTLNERGEIASVTVVSGGAQGMYFHDTPPRCFCYNALPDDPVCACRMREVWTHYRAKLAAAGVPDAVLDGMERDRDAEIREHSKAAHKDAVQSVTSAAIPSPNRTEKGPLSG